MTSSPGSRTTSRLTGLAYLGLAITGAVGFMLIRQQLYVPGDATATAANLLEKEGLARLGIAVDLAAVLTQALAALWFFRLFRVVDSFAAGALAVFGMVNAVVILVATAFSATALGLVVADGAADGSQAATAQVLYDLNATTWSVGGLFFGLWLIPMGWLAWRSAMPRLLGWALVVGGASYVLSTFVTYLAPALDWSTAVLTIPATIGELWIVGYLLVAPRRGLPVATVEAARVAVPVRTGR